MKRALLFAIVCCFALGTSGSSAATAQHTSYRSFGVFSSLSPSGFLNVTASTSVTTTVGGAQTTSTQICFQLFDPANNFDDGCGPATNVTIDPLVLSGSALGIIPGRFGPVAISASFTATHVNNNAPYIDAELVPSTTPSSTVFVNYGRQGRGSASASNTYGNFSISNATGYSSSFEVVTVTT